MESEQGFNVLLPFVERRENIVQSAAGLPAFQWPPNNAPPPSPRANPGPYSTFLCWPSSLGTVTASGGISPSSPTPRSCLQALAGPSPGYFCISLALGSGVRAATSVSHRFHYEDLKH